MLSGVIIFFIFRSTVDLPTRKKDIVSLRFFHIFSKTSLPCDGAILNVLFELPSSPVTFALPKLSITPFISFSSIIKASITMGILLLGCGSYVGKRVFITFSRRIGQVGASLLNHCSIHLDKLFDGIQISVKKNTFHTHKNCSKMKKKS